MSVAVRFTVFIFLTRAAPRAAGHKQRGRLQAQKHAPLQSGAARTRPAANLVGGDGQRPHLTTEPRGRLHADFRQQVAAHILRVLLHQQTPCVAPAEDHAILSIGSEVTISELLHDASVTAGRRLCVFAAADDHDWLNVEAPLRLFL